MLPKETAAEGAQRRWLTHLYNNYTGELEQYLRFEVCRYVDVYCGLASELQQHHQHQQEEMLKFIQDAKMLTPKG